MIVGLGIGCICEVGVEGIVGVVGGGVMVLGWVVEFGCCWVGDSGCWELGVDMFFWFWLEFEFWWCELFWLFFWLWFLLLLFWLCWLSVVLLGWWGEGLLLLDGGLLGFLCFLLGVIVFDKCVGVEDYIIWGCVIGVERERLLFVEVRLLVGEWLKNDVEVNRFMFEVVLIE